MTGGGCDVCGAMVCERPRRCNRERTLMEERVRRAHVRPDEEPDTDFDPTHEASFRREEEFASGYCERCGHQGHTGYRCPTVTPDLLKGRS